MPPNENIKDFEFSKRLGNIKGVLFDLDGVLIDSTEGWVLAIEDVLTSEEIPVPDRDTLLKMIAWTTKEQIQAITPDQSLEVITRLTNSVDRYFIENIKENVQLYNGAQLILNILKRVGLKIALVTNNSRVLTFEILEAFKLFDYFDEIITQDDVINPKPAPDPILEVIDRLKISKQDVFFVGDSMSDITACQAAGVRCIILERTTLESDFFKNLENREELIILKDLFQVKDLLEL
ncbi:MAG: HAD family hydrolase [Candidatus Hodarchaeales archaeon]